MSSAELLTEAQRWLRFADEDIDTAEALCADPDIVPRHACWLAQQAAEKALALVVEGINFPFRHDLDAPRRMLPQGWRVRTEHPDLAELTEWAVEARYPGDWPEATVDDANRAVAQARAVVESVRADLTSRPPAQ
jgi:HEPN domain-containing protein